MAASNTVEDPWLASMKEELRARIHWATVIFRERRRVCCTRCAEIKSCFILNDGSVLCPNCDTGEYERGSISLITYEVQHWSARTQESKLRTVC